MSNHPDLSQRQEDIFLFILQQFVTCQRLPAMADIADEMGFSSPNAAQDHIDALIRKGYLLKREQEPGKRKSQPGYLIASAQISITLGEIKAHALH